jgi:UDP-glucose 4-epimerase
MRVLVTGGAGYIGGVASEVLVRSGHEVCVFDNLSKGHRAAVPEGAEFILGDLRDLAQVRTAFNHHHPDAVLHFAGHIQVGESTRDPMKYLGDNVEMGLNLMRAMVETGVHRCILSSTANLYDRPRRIPIDEDSVVEPGSPYGESKLYLERILGWLDRTHGIRSASLRYFNAAGATETRGENHDPETHLIPLALQAALGQREGLSVFGDDYDTPDGTCIRDYIHVSDLAEAHVLALLALDKGTRTYNLGNGSGFSVKQVINAAERVTGRSIAVTVSPRREGDVARLISDSSRIQRELGWKPRIPELDRIIETAWTWLRKHPQGYGEGPRA